MRIRNMIVYSIAGTLSLVPTCLHAQQTHRTTVLAAFTAPEVRAAPEWTLDPTAQNLGLGLCGPSRGESLDRKPSETKPSAADTSESAAPSGWPGSRLQEDVDEVLDSMHERQTVSMSEHLDNGVAIRIPQKRSEYHPVRGDGQRQPAVKIAFMTESYQRPLQYPGWDLHRHICPINQ